MPASSECSCAAFACQWPKEQCWCYCHNQHASRPLSELAPPEVRIVDPQTGGEKGMKLQRFSLIPFEFLWALATHYGIGARKYADRNWERGYKWSLSLDAHDRHLYQFMMGERRDPETGSHHLIAAAWHLVALYIFDVRSLGTNDLTSEVDLEKL